jgi:hypothetical protein
LKGYEETLSGLFIQSLGLDADTLTSSPPFIFIHSFTCFLELKINFILENILSMHIYCHIWTDAALFAETIAAIYSHKFPNFKKELLE